MHYLSVRKVASDLAFVEEAAQHFRDNPHNHSYTRDELAADELVALRWNDTCVLVIRIHANYDPIVFELTEPLT